MLWIKANFVAPETLPWRNPWLTAGDLRLDAMGFNLMVLVSSSSSATRMWEKIPTSSARSWPVLWRQALGLHFYICESLFANFTIRRIQHWLIRFGSLQVVSTRLKERAVSMPLHWRVVSDNASGETKNNVVMKFLGVQVALGRIR